MRTDHHGMQENHYRHLALMTTLSFASMYVLMYAMVNAFGNVFNNVNQVYMAGVMTAPMVVIELLVMRGMYQDGRRHALILAAAILAGVAFFAAIRWQTAVGDTQFLRSMIPHHAAAVLMCEKAPIRDGEIRRLCESIISSQQAEIDQMKRRLSQLRD
jgi:uncharacterized protein (DUF305 family)